MIWALYATLGNNMWTEKEMDVEHISFEEKAWVDLVDMAHERGFNTIFLDLGEGIEWSSHPEISLKGAWSRDKVKSEVLRLRDMGIRLYPKLNFSACHHLWLGEYRKMMCTPIYYTVVRDLIREAHEMFLEPEYIHLAMDEEGTDTQFNSYSGYQNYRKGEIFWHDLRYLFDCVKELGAIPWVWTDPALADMDEFKKRISPDEVVLNMWWYRAFKTEHFTRIDDDINASSHRERFPHMYVGCEYVEDVGNKRNIFGKYYDIMHGDYKKVPCASFVFKSKWNCDDVFDVFKTECKEGTLLGYMTAPWKHTLVKNTELHRQDLDQFVAAKNKYFPES